ncbi:MAG: ATP-binding protein [Oscillospiraceae bacterium]|nr:ATP-binding protein [Oscillospiraceae bacterium]
MMQIKETFQKLSDSDESASAQSKKRLLNFRLMVVLVVSALVIGIAMMLLLSMIFQQRVETEYTNKAVLLSKIAASLVDGDSVDRYVSTLEKDDEYDRILGHLMVQQQESEVAYIYISQINGREEIIVFDAEDTEEVDLGFIIPLDDLQFDDILQALADGQRVEPFVVDTEWGRLFTSAEPVFRTDGSVAAYANVAIAIDEILRERTYVYIILGAIILLFSLAFAAVGFYTVRRIVLAEVKQLEAVKLANKAKTQFLANMSHEIRTPMNAILGITEIELQKESHPQDTMEAFTTMYESGNLLLNIINDILDLSKIEAGKLELNPTKYDIPSLINDVVQINRMRYESKPIEFALEIDPKTPLNMFGDELRIKQILSNIISNAYKYTNKGTVRLSVSFEKTEAVPNLGETNGIAGSDVIMVFTITDTGQGMTDQQVAKLFEEYTRFNMAANRSTVGTGLGMNITKRLVDMMNGTIEVESELDKGSTFTVRIPQRRINGLVCGKGLAERLQDFSFKSTSINKKTRMLREYMPYGSVLVVDDVQSNVYVAKGMLLPYGLQIDTAVSGMEAIEKVKSGRVYDVIFMDHMMPEMDGIEAVEIIRSMGYTHSIVALTANALVGHAEMFLQNGFDAFVSKPIDSRELNSVLNELIRDKQPPEVVEEVRRKQRGDRMSSATAASYSAGENSELYKIFRLDAQNAIEIIEEICEKPGTPGDTDIYNYEIAVHGIKSALAGIGKTELSDKAYRLERLAAEKNTETLLSQTPEFLEELRGLL